MSHSLVMYNRNHTWLVSSLFSVLVERLVSVVVKCVVKDQQVMGLFVQASFKSLSIFFQFGLTSVDSHTSHPQMVRQLHFRSLRSKLNLNFMGNLQKENSSVIVVRLDEATVLSSN